VIQEAIEHGREEDGGRPRATRLWRAGGAGQAGEGGKRALAGCAGSDAGE
jgi:hypothetical protein